MTLVVIFFWLFLHVRSSADLFTVRKISFLLKDVSLPTSSSSSESSSSCWYQQPQGVIQSDSLCLSLSRFWFSSEGSLARRWILLNLEQRNSDYLVSLAFLPHSLPLPPLSSSSTSALDDTQLTEEELQSRLLYWLTGAPPTSLHERAKRLPWMIEDLNFPALQDLKNLKSSQEGRTGWRWKKVELISCAPVSLTALWEDDHYVFTSQSLDSRQDLCENFPKPKSRFHSRFFFTNSTTVNATATFPDSSSSNYRVYLASILAFFLIVIALALILGCVVYCCPKSENQFKTKSQLEMNNFD